MQVLEDLYLGDIHPSERSFKKGSQYAKALNNVVKVGDAFIGSLTEKQKEQFEAYLTAQREVNVLTDCETFCYAFWLGAKIMLDVLTDSAMKKSDNKARPGVAVYHHPWPYYSLYCVFKNAVMVSRNKATSETSFFVSEMEQM